MKLINADKLLEALGVFKDKKHGDPHFLNGIETAREIIEGMPKAVMRCDKCRWHYDKDDAIVCANSGDVVQSDDYCSYGERKTAESE